jgi:hypothetical protein
MGSSSYWYYTSYQPDLNAALESLREREFQSGRYNPATEFPEFPIIENSVIIGAQHESIDDALEASEADGTRSILDILQVIDKPSPFSRDEFDEALQAGGNYEILGEIFNTARPLSSLELLALFGTEQPTHDMIESVIIGNTDLELSDVVKENSSNFRDNIARGTAKYIIVYAESQPSEIFFIGYSFD